MIQYRSLWARRQFLSPAPGGWPGGRWVLRRSMRVWLLASGDGPSMQPRSSSCFLPYCMKHPLTAMMSYDAIAEAMSDPKQPELHPYGNITSRCDVRTDGGSKSAMPGTEEQHLSAISTRMGAVCPFAPHRPTRAGGSPPAYPPPITVCSPSPSVRRPRSSRRVNHQRQGNGRRTRRVQEYRWGRTARRMRGKMG